MPKEKIKVKPIGTNFNNHQVHSFSMLSSNNI